MMVSREGIALYLSPCHMARSVPLHGVFPRFRCGNWFQGSLLLFIKSSREALGF